MSKEKYVILSMLIMLFWIIMTLPFGCYFGWNSPVPNWYFIILFVLFTNILICIGYNLFSIIKD